MFRLIFWIKKIIRGKDQYCRCFCAACEHFDECREDMESL